MSVFRTEAEPVTTDRADAAAPVHRLDDETADTIWARRVLHIDALSQTHPLGAELKTMAGTFTGDADAKHYRTEISRLDQKDEARATPEKSVKELAAERAKILVVALRRGIQTVKVDGKDIDVTDADTDAVLLAIAKKAYPALDFDDLDFTPEQILKLVAQKVGSQPEPPPEEAPPMDGDMPEDELEEEEGAPPKAPKADAFDPFVALACIDGHGSQSATPRKRGRTYADAHDAMEQRIRAASRRYQLDVTTRRDGTTVAVETFSEPAQDLGARLDANIASRFRKPEGSR